MLKKLLKYDLQNIFKFLIIFYGLALFFGILTRIFLSIDNSFIMNLIGQICSGACISMMFSILINNLMRLWVRFKQNLYGDESYLIHTLPVDKKVLYLSKFITGIVTLFTSVLVVGIKNMLLPIANVYGSTIIKILIAILFVFFLELFNAIQAGFTGIILGHRMNNAKIGYSVLFGFIAYMVTQMFALLMIFIVALFNKDMMNLFVTNNIIDMEMMKVIIYLSISTYLITLVGGYFVNIKLFKKGVNVE